MISLTDYEFKKLKYRRNLVLDSSGRSIHKNHKDDEPFQEVYDEAITALRDIQSFVQDVFFTEPIGLSVKVNGNKQSDVDNILKAVADSLQGVCYKNDREISKCSCERIIE